ncbi:MAG: MFS transporter [Ilumatobacteraceae bacterium]
MLGRAIDSLLGADESPEVRRHVGTLTAARICTNACYRFAPPFLALIARGVGVSLQDIGIALAIAELAGLMSPLTGRLVDRLPRRTALATGLLGVGLGTVLAASSTSLVMFAVALVLLSQAKVMFDLGLGAWIADHVPYERRGRVVGLTETSWALGLLVGVSVMGVITGLTSWRVGYLVGAGTVLLMAAVVGRGIRPEPRADTSDHHDQRAGGLGLASLGTYGWLIVAGECLLMMSSQTLFVTFGSWLGDVFGFGAVGISAVVFGLGLGELAASITSVRRTDVWGKETSAARGAMVMVPAAIALALGHGHLAIGIAALVVAVLGFEFAIVSIISVGTSLVPNRPARGLGILLAGGTMGRAIASVPATRLYERDGMVAPAIMCAVLATCAAVTMLVAHRAGTRPR